MSHIWNFDYTSCKTEVLTLQPGIYRLEVWGARGGSKNSGAMGGLGGYSTGVLTLNEETKAFIHVGSQGSDTANGDGSQGCNGGGYSVKDGGNGRSGGGATDIRLISDDLQSRIIVAGGGGGSGDISTENGGFGGGLRGGNATNNNGDVDEGKGASQDRETIGCASKGTCITGTFGFGANGGSGAGGGWFGGSAPNGHSEGSGGGSGYVLTEKSFKPSEYKLNNKIYFLKNAETIGGDKSFPSPTSSSNETGHTGNGFARITSIISYRPYAKCSCRCADTKGAIKYLTMVLTIGNC